MRQVRGVDVGLAEIPGIGQGLSGCCPDVCVRLGEHVSDEVSVARFIADQRTFYRVPLRGVLRDPRVSTSWFYK